jgi:arabinan endo-1,5-alpha-L-arabinosidase
MTPARNRLTRARAFVSSLALLGFASTTAFAANAPRQLPLTGDLTVHDPTLIRHRDLVYLFCTASGRRSGGIIPIHTSPDLTNWTRIGYAIENEQNLWLAWGSFWSGLKMRRIDPSTGKLSSHDTILHSLAGRPRDPSQSPPQVGAIEAPTLVKRDQFWYLFASFDFCCRGTNSTYNIRVGRSAAVTGPYLDRAGVPMLDGGGTVVIEAITPHWRGPGHQTIFRDRDGADYLVFHAYHGETGRAELRISTMEWVGGWPAAAPLP